MLGWISRQLDLLRAGWMAPKALSAFCESNYQLALNLYTEIEQLGEHSAFDTSAQAVCLLKLRRIAEGKRKMEQALAQLSRERFPGREARAFIASQLRIYGEQLHSDGELARLAELKELIHSLSEYGTRGRP